MSTHAVRSAVSALLLFVVAPGHAAIVPSVFGGKVICLPVSGVQYCAGTQLTRVETWDGVPLDVNVTIPPAAMDGPFPLIVDLHGWGVGKSNQPYIDYAMDGYVVLSYSARGFHLSCGTPASRVPDPTLSNPNVCNERGWIRLADARYEVRDTQYLAGVLADEGLVIPDRVGVTGGSYGGGQSMMLAVLKDRVMLPDETLVPWLSPGGTPMRIAAAAPLIPWSDLAYALTPNGETLDYRVLNPYGLRGGVMKQSYVNFLYNVGTLSGFFAAPGVDPDADLQTWNARLAAGEPYDGDPQLEDIVDEVTSHHSAYYLDDSVEPAPLFIYNAFTDDLFPATEGLRFWRKTRALYPAAEITLLFGSFFGHPRASLTGDMATALARANALFARHLKGSGAPLPGIETFTQNCGGSTLQGPFTAADWDAIHPGEVRYAEAGAKTYGSAGGNVLTATTVDPLGPQAAFVCRTVAAADDPGAASYSLPPVTDAGYTLMGSPTVIATLEADGFAQVAARLWDVAPNGMQFLVSQGFYRPRIDDPSVQVFQLPANGFHFVAGHVPKLELLGQSAPFGRASNGTFSVTVTNLELRLPVLEAPGGVVQPPAPPVLPGGTPGACAAAPVTVCKASGRARLVVRDAEPDRLLWKWSRGTTLFSEFGSPTTTTDYALCVYGGDALLSTLAAPAGPKWTQRARGYRYLDPSLSPSGVGKVDLRAGTQRARLLLKAEGVTLDRPALPITALPARAQLVSSTGACWETPLDVVRRNTETTFLATD
jgi:predicted acyl esterase